jgi:hypothetical protein
MAALVAERIAAQRPLEVMSYLDADGREHVTDAGARAVLQGLAKGTTQFGDAALQGIHIDKDTRTKIQTEWMAELIQEGVDLGLDKTKATSRMKRLWYGPLEDQSIQGIGDILWSDNISYTDTLKFQQLNTTYVMGPDGRPWATSWTRDGVMGALGLKPINRALISEQAITSNDTRLNTTYLGGVLGGINTGLRALELVDESRYVPTDVEIGKSIEDAIKEASNKDYTPFTPYSTKKGTGYTPYKRYAHGGYGGGSGYFSAGYSDFSRMYALPHGRAPFGIDVPFINTSNPLIRRSNVRRERVWSERGRLNQWQ